MAIEVRSSSVGDTLAIAEAIGRRLPSGVLILLVGELGAGKTVFAKGLGRGLGVVGEITSPSYNLMIRYKGRVEFDHWDLYRVSDIDDDLEFLESVYNTESVKAVEWGDKLKEAPEVPTLEIEIELVEGETSQRVMRLNGSREIISTTVEPVLKEWMER